MTEEEGVGVGAALYSWGSNSEGALGLNDVSDRFSFYVMWTIHEKKRHAHVLFLGTILKNSNTRAHTQTQTCITQNAGKCRLWWRSAGA
jgi:hypothetical protein